MAILPTYVVRREGTFFTDVSKGEYPSPRPFPRSLVPGSFRGRGEVVCPSRGGGGKREDWYPSQACSRVGGREGREREWGTPTLPLATCLTGKPPSLSPTRVRSVLVFRIFPICDFFKTQESPPAWKQEAYHLPCSKSLGGGTYLGQGVPT